MTASGPFVAVDHDPFADAPLQRALASSEAQREIWLACQLGTEASLAYNEVLRVDLRGELDIDALGLALQRLVERHDALRATFSADGRQMLIARELPPQLSVLDLGALSAAQRDATLQQQVRAAVETPFDLVRGPLLRPTLLRLGGAHAVLLLSAHHIICDGWSFGVLLHDLAALYAQACGGGEAPGAPGSFADLVLALQRRAGDVAHADDEAWWLQHYAEAAPVLELPLDRARPPQRRFAAARIDHELPRELVEQLRAFGGARGASLFTTLLAGFAGLLQRLSNADEVVIGVPAAGQTLPGHADTVGHAVNLLPLRLRIAPDLPLSDSLGAVQQEVIDAFEHQHYTFGTLLKKLVLQRDAARVPLAAVMFNVDQPLRVDGPPGLQIDAAGVARSHENFELSVNAVPAGGGLRLECQYSTALFDAASVRRWLGAYETLLRGACANAQRAAGDLELVGAADLARLHELNATTLAPAAQATVHAWLLARAAPQAAALQAGGATLNTEALWARAHRLARALRARGIARGCRVGLCLPRDAAMLPALLGVLLSGAAYVPLDPSFPSARLADMAADAELALLLSASSVADALPWPRQRSLWLDADADEIECGDAGALPADPARDACADDPAYLIYTSGSTGRPKGVVLPHRAALNFLQAVAQRPGLRAGDRLLAVTTLSFDIALLELLLPLACGACVVLATREQAGDADALRAMLEAERITALQATPGTWRMLLDAGWSGDAALKALVGGEALPADLAAQLLARCAEVWNMYGPTETAVWSSCWRVAPAMPISIGTPLANNRVWIVDARGQLCPIGVPGEICIGGLGVASGYWQRPELNAERFVGERFGPDPSAPMYRTGDRGRWRDDGLLEHLGRLDFQVKLRGFRIELGEIEARALQHPDVAQALALVREETPGDARLVVYLVAAAGRTAPAAAVLRAHLRPWLPAYMLPQHVVELDALPRLPNGKIDRRRLPAPQPLSRADTPLTPTERQVARVMEHVLQIAGVDADTDFFALGGHSLLAAQLAARLRDATAVEVGMAVVFSLPTVRALAAWIDAQRDRPPASTAAIASRAAQDRAPASTQQLGVWLAEQFGSGQPTYNLPSAHRLLGALDVDALQRALDALCARQTALRTALVEQDGVPVQQVSAHARIALGAPIELTALPPAQREAELRRALRSRCAEAIALDQAPMVRAALYRVDAQEHVLFFMPHHAIWDGWSFDLLYAELGELYAAQIERRPPRLDALAVSYGDYAAWQQGWLRSPELQAQLEHWRRKLLPLPAPLELPLDRQRPAQRSGAGDTVTLRRPADWFVGIEGFARAHDATPFMVLLAAFAALLWREAGQDELIVGTPVRGRPRRELESIMGFFVNTLPLRLRVDAQVGFDALLATVRGAVLEAFATSDAPFTEMLRLPGMRRDPARSPIYQAFFSYQDARRRERRWGDLQHHQMPVHAAVAAEDLGLWLLVGDDGTVGGLSYDTALFDAARVEQWAADYFALVDALCAEPRRALGALRNDRAATPAVAAATVTAAPASAARGDGELLATVWRELLGIDTVDASDNFFDLGGHSLLVTQAIARMRKLTGKSVSAQTYMVENLAQIAARYQAAAAPRGIGALLGRLRRRRSDIA